MVDSGMLFVLLAVGAAVAFGVWWLMGRKDDTGNGGTGTGTDGGINS